MWHLYVRSTGSVPVGLVNDQPADGAEGDAQRVPDVVDQATRRGDQDVNALTQPEDRKEDKLSPGPESESRPGGPVKGGGGTLPGLFSLPLLPAHQNSRYDPGERLQGDKQQPFKRLC